jgi:tetratricopeptide (TPR) repeat protein
MGKHLDRAQILLEQNRYDLAEQELRQEIAENLELAEAYSPLAFCLIKQRKSSDEALKLIRYALSLDAEDDRNHYVLAIFWYCQGKLDLARSAIAAAIELDPNSSVYFWTLAYILFDRAQVQFQAASVGSRGVLELFKSYAMRPFLKPVFPPLEKSLALDPQYLPALNLYTELLILTGRNQKALVSNRAASVWEASGYLIFSYGSIPKVSFY